MAAIIASIGLKKIRISRFAAYVDGMRKSAFEPCIPTKGTKVPDRPEWLHEVNYDGYRLIIQREGKRVRLFTQTGMIGATNIRSSLKQRFAIAAARL